MPDSDSGHDSTTLDFRKIKPGPIESVKQLQERLQLALQVELAMIPPYLTAMYAMRDKTCEAYQILRGVVMEEMLHVNQVANLLIAAGGTPRLGDSAMPVYPCYLPAGGIIRRVDLTAPNYKEFLHTFMEIEAPDAHMIAADTYASIGQLYAEIQDGFVALENAPEIQAGFAAFSKSPDGAGAMEAQRTGFYLGKSGGRCFDITGLSRVKDAITMIREQGEGASLLGEAALRSLKNNDVRSTGYGYGRRIDETYGPLMDHPRELSHFAKFARLVNLRGTYPMWPVISASIVKGYGDYELNVTRDYAEFFDILYTMLLRVLEISFLPGQRHVFFELALPIMCEYMPHFGSMLVQMPIHADGDLWVGPNAAPLFRYVRDPLSTIDRILSSTSGGPLVEYYSPVRCLVTSIQELFSELRG